MNLCGDEYTDQCDDKEDLCYFFIFFKSCYNDEETVFSAKQSKVP